MSTPRSKAIAIANARHPRKIDLERDAQGRALSPAEFFGRSTFSTQLMADKLPKPVYKRVQASLEQTGRLDVTDADAVAHAVKEWALSQGATHFTHWFQPMTGSTAEKHDAFLTFDRSGQALERFSGAELIQSEPDASSFPSGGTRSTFEARGYTAWDPSSPMFIMESENGKTLCIPSAFVSYTGEALDLKTPLLRSMQALNTSAGDMFAAMGLPRARVIASVGCEQEYFLVDRAYWSLRPDLSTSGRTIVGAAPPKGQSLDDHYFGSISPRVQAFMQEVEQELYKLGVPAKTRHNEVAPTQYEMAPIFREANVGVDHNQLIQEVMSRIAMRHDYKVLCHEKPYAGINGSGKHVNWSMSADGENLLEPGDHPEDNDRFLASVAAVLLGVYRYGGLLRASVATHGNDFRLGANEAPPAIMSVFLGEQLTAICDRLAAGNTPETTAEGARLELGVEIMPAVDKDNTDRNRTSPVAFTGNKFEFRAVGSEQNPSWPATVLNTIVAAGLRQMSKWVVSEGGVGPAVRKAMIETAGVRFEGNGYSEEWVVEAARRGLKNFRKTPEALDELRDEAVIKLFADHAVLNAQEVESRYNVQMERYIMDAEIEADNMRLLVDEYIVPVVLDERAVRASALLDLLALSEGGAKVDFSIEESQLNSLGGKLSALIAARAALDVAVAEAEQADHHGRATAQGVMPA
ncbi:MAG: glutamine synthetase, partial [Myxococcota bacterium]